MAKVNTARGEASLVLGGKTYRLLPTYQNLVALEEATGMGLIELVVALGEGAIRLNMLARAIEAVIDPEISEDEIGQHMAENGVGDVLAQLALFLTTALSGGQKAKKGKSKAAKAKG